MGIFMKLTLYSEAPATVLSALAAAGAAPYAPCGGRGVCGGCRCRLRLLSGELSEPDAHERARLGGRALAEGWRLSCRAVFSGECEVEYTEAAVAEAREMARDETCAGKADELGVALDIGTTTVEASLVRLDTGARLSSLRCANPQSVFGADVISRMGAIMDGRATVDELSALIRGRVSGLLASLGAPEGARAVAVGNTVMMSLFADVDPTPVGVAPFEPVTLFDADEGGFYLPRCVSGYFGADAVASVLAAEQSYGGDFALIDIGTNGEAAVMRGGRLYAAAAAAGPALEGGGISCGMPAKEGAITSARIEAGEIRVVTVGGGEARGICGSGLIDVVACLLALGIIDRDGVMAEPAVEVGGVTLTRADVRAFQLAKAALRAALDRVAGISGLEPGARLFVTGSFGGALNAASCVRVGLIPRSLASDVAALPSGALSGAELILCRDGARERARQLAAGAVYTELSGSQEFERAFLRALGF